MSRTGIQMVTLIGPSHLDTLEEGDLFCWTTPQSPVMVVTQRWTETRTGDIGIEYLGITGEDTGKTDTMVTFANTFIYKVNLLSTPAF